MTVNNFITSDKPAQQTPSKIYNTRPFSSDGKDRKVHNPSSKIHPSDSNTSANFKNPYESKLSSKLGTHYGRKKKE